MREPSLIDGERIISHGQSCFSVTCTAWKPGFLFLTNKRLIFSQPSGRVVFEITLERVTEAGLVKGRFILGLKRKLLHILYRSTTREKVLQAFLAVNKPEQWEKAVMEEKAIADEEKSTPLIDVFDEKDHLTIVMGLPGVKKDDVKLTVTDNVVTIYVNAISQKYHREVKLAASVKAEPIDVTCMGGVLRVRMEKLHPPQRLD